MAMEKMATSFSASFLFCVGGESADLRTSNAFVLLFSPPGYTRSSKAWESIWLLFGL